MKVSAVINSRIIKSKTERKDSLAVIIFILLFAGIIFGNIVYILSQEYVSSSIVERFIMFSTDFSNKSKIEVFSGILLSHLPYIILSIISGTCALGYWIVSVLAVVKISGIGIISAYLYSEYALKGLEYSALIFFPGKLIMIFAVVLLMNFTIRMSFKIKDALKGERGNDINMPEYYIKSISCLALFMLSSAIDCLALTAFSHLFDFA